MKKKTCKICKSKFEPEKPLQMVCKKIECAIEYGRIHLKRTKIQSDKKKRLERKEMKESIKTSKDYRNELQRKINALVRAIDEGCKCISIDCKETENIEAGHFRAVGAGQGSPIRFHLLNLYAECKNCNRYKSSKYAYYDGLIETFGDDIFQIIHDLPTIWKELKLDIEQLKQASKNVTECMKFVKEYKSDKILPLLPDERIELRKVCNNLIGIY